MMLAGMSKYTYIHQYRNHLDLGCWFSPAILAIRLAIRLKFLFTICTRFEQYTYLGFVLLEAPRENVLHGPLLSIN